MSYISELVRNVPVGHNFTVHCDADELYDAWRNSGRAGHCEILVVPCHITGGYDVRIMSTERDEYDGNLLRLAFVVSCVCFVVFSVIGWALS